MVEDYRDRIQQKLVMKRWPQSELADRSGISSSKLSRLFQRKAELSVSELLAVAAAFECECGDLVGTPPEVPARFVPFLPLESELTGLSPLARDTLLRYATETVRAVRALSGGALLPPGVENRTVVPAHPYNPQSKKTDETRFYGSETRANGDARRLSDEAEAPSEQPKRKKSKGGQS